MYVIKSGCQPQGSKKFLRNFQKPLDKPQRVCYNMYVIKRRATSKAREKFSKKFEKPLDKLLNL
jgi:hypothetical protein